MKKQEITWLPLTTFRDGRMWALWAFNPGFGFRDYVGNVFKEGNHWEANLRGNRLLSRHKSSQAAAKRLLKEIKK